MQHVHVFRLDCENFDIFSPWITNLAAWHYVHIQQIRCSMRVIFVIIHFFGYFIGVQFSKFSNTITRRDCVSLIVRKCVYMQLGCQQWSWYLTLWSLYIGPPWPTKYGRIQQLAYNTNYKQGATKMLKLLNKCLLMVLAKTIWFNS